MGETAVKTGSTASVVRNELAALFPLATPIIVTQLAQMSMGVADTVMAGRVSAADLAGVALGGNLYWPVMITLGGVLQSVTPSVAQLRGAGNVDRIAHVIRQALWLALGGGAVLFVVLQFSRYAYEFIGVDPAGIPIAVTYLQGLLWGLPPVLGYFVLRYLCEGMGWTLPGMVIALAALLLKLPLNYLFIHGGFGIAAMGGAGCGWSSAIVMWFELFAILGVMRFSRMHSVRVFANFERPARAEVVRLVRLGVPIGASRFFEVSLFSLVALLVGRLGIDSLAAHQIAGTMNGVTFMIPLSLGVAATIRVGYNVGAGRLDEARLSAFVAFGASLLFAAAAGIALLAFRTEIAAWYSTDASVVALAADLLIFIAVYQIFDDTQATAIGALFGYKDTRIPMWVTLVSYWFVALPLGVGLAFGTFGSVLGVKGFWWGLSAGLGLVACILTARLNWLSRRPERIASFAHR
jgi:MATE family multidrug resistance protein